MGKLRLRIILQLCFISISIGASQVSQYPWEQAGFEIQPYIRKKFQAYDISHLDNRIIVSSIAIEGWEKYRNSNEAWKAADEQIIQFIDTARQNIEEMSALQNFFKFSGKVPVD